MNLVFPECNASVKTIIHGCDLAQRCQCLPSEFKVMSLTPGKLIIRGLTGCLIYYHGIPHSTAPHWGTHFMAKEVSYWAHAQGIHWSSNVPYHPEVAGLIVGKVFWGHGYSMARWQKLAGLGKVLQRVVHAVNQCLLHGTLSPTARIHGSGIKVWKWEWYQSH